MSIYSFEAHRSRYLIRCYHCVEKFDAVQAAWCECVSRTPTLLCPSCDRCFCAAPHEFKLDFWAGAPSDFVRRNPFHSRFNVDPAPMLRPLILVIDDVPTMRLLAMAMLRKLGYGVVVARDGEEGLRLARELRPDLILTDALMPRLDGRALCRAIKDDPELGHVKVIIMSAVYTSKLHQNEAVTRFRADEFLAKPFNVGALRAVLLELIGPPAEAELDLSAALSS